MLKKLATAAAMTATLLLAGCNVNASMNIDTDLLVSGKVSVQMDAPSTANGEANSCANFTKNFNHMQQANQSNPGARLALETQADRSTQSKLDCDFTFKRWDPNFNKTVLTSNGYRYVLHTTEPAKLLAQMGDGTSLNLKLTFPLPITAAPGGQINGKAVTYTSIKAFQEGEIIVAGDASKQSYWQKYGTATMIGLAVFLAGFVGYALMRVREEQKKDK